MEKKYIEKKSKFSVKQLTYMSVIIAIAVAINTLRVGLVSFGGFPIILGGYLLGPIPGFIIGGLSDLIGFYVRPSGYDFNILFTLTSALTGLLPVFVSKILGDRYPKYSLIKIFIGILFGQVLTSVILVPLFSTILYGDSTFYILAIKALIKQAISIPIYSILIFTLINRLTKVIDFRKV